MQAGTLYTKLASDFESSAHKGGLIYFEMGCRGIKSKMSKNNIKEIKVYAKHHPS